MLRWLSKGTVVLAGLIFANPILPPTPVYPIAPMPLYQPSPPLPQVAIPQPNGGYTVINPGQLPTFIRPMPNGGFIIQPPTPMPRYDDNGS